MFRRYEVSQISWPIIIISMIYEFISFPIWNYYLVWVKIMWNHGPSLPQTTTSMLIGAIITIAGLWIIRITMIMGYLIFRR
jgi:hypothetical protein